MTMRIEGVGCAKEKWATRKSLSHARNVFFKCLEESHFLPTTRRRHAEKLAVCMESHLSVYNRHAYRVRHWRGYTIKPALHNKIPSFSVAIISCKAFEGLYNHDHMDSHFCVKYHNFHVYPTHTSQLKLHKKLCVCSSPHSVCASWTHLFKAHFTIFV